MRIKDLILPEDRVFFELLDEMAGTIERAAVLLDRITLTLQGSTPLCREIHQLEHEGDGITRQIYERLNQSLITPLEPEEISRLAPALDDVLDQINWVAHQLCNYGITEADENVREFSRLIGLSTAEIRKGIVSLRTLKKPVEVQQGYVEINRHYNISLELLSTAIPGLFTSGDPMHVIKLKDIYENMAEVLEKCNDFGHVLNDIAISHS
ncbi:MAG: DUF47 family protein [Methanoregulaceae archaeon]|nr:DUF47 family protein [Methanoregulaceae archaeon]